MVTLVMDVWIIKKTTHCNTECAMSGFLHISIIEIFYRLHIRVHKLSNEYCTVIQYANIETQYCVVFFFHSSAELLYFFCCHAVLSS